MTVDREIDKSSEEIVVEEKPEVVEEETKIEAPQIVPKKIVPKSDGKSYSIIIGSFKTDTNADRLCEKFRRLGFDSEIVKLESSWYRVIAHTYNNKSEANRNLKVIRTTMKKPDAWLLIE